MPLYEYACPQCDVEFELLIRSDEKANCPHCGGVDLNRLLSAPAAHVGGKADLPICAPQRPAGAGCGMPQCGTGGCMGMGDT